MGVFGLINNSAVAAIAYRAARKSASGGKRSRRRTYAPKPTPWRETVEFYWPPEQAEDDTEDDD